MSDEQKSLISMFKNKDPLKEYCSSGTDIRKNILKHSPCINKVNQKACGKDLQTALITVTSNEVEKRIPAGCCAFRRFNDCSEKLIEARCGREAIEYKNFMIKLVASRLPSIVCGAFDPESNQCKGLIPPVGAEPKQGKAQSVFSRLLQTYNLGF